MNNSKRDRNINEYEKLLEIKSKPLGIPNDFTLKMFGFSEEFIEKMTEEDKEEIVKRTLEISAAEFD